MSKPVVYTAHANTVLLERGLNRAWVERVLREPQWIEPDRLDPTVVRYFGAVPEREGRYLRVAAVETPVNFRIVSVFLDRRARPK